MITHFDMILRIAVGAALGGVIGFERDLHRRQVGLRTHLIVAMASATFMVISTQFFAFQSYLPDARVSADVSRIASTVVSGIGFLAGGAILKTGATLQGVTTAAGLWLVTAIGLACGAGMYVEGVASTVMGLIALTFFRHFEDKNDMLIRRFVTLTIRDQEGGVSSLLKKLTALGIKFSDFDYEKKLSEKVIKIQFSAGVPTAMGTSRFIEELEKHVGIEQIVIKAAE